jgi:hypothetical protein
MTSTRDRIRALNDELRIHHRNGRIFITPGILALGADAIIAIDQAVSSFDKFDIENDPHSEHDFGAITVDGAAIFFKIDYYDRDARFGSPDPADPAVTLRIMTIMLAEEY